MFTVHGLWPDHCDGSFEPVTCDAARNYQDVEAVLKQRDMALYQQMRLYWPSFTTNSDFWQHEWYKHGTCLNVVNPECISNYQLYDDMILFFKQTMELAKKYDIYGALKKEGIVPGNTYKKEDMVNALFKQLGIRVVPRCRNNVLTEFWSYFDLYGNNMYVPRVPDYNPSDCANILYPEKTLAFKCPPSN
ncbi:Ribonuclease Rh [Smittium culicis]|uniref:ribonuclease T2 n=1 Tax=Smittium culicis TaxID=133412 RepID=A0A1R1YRA9_9FUNG|nr:Ribonuclease Rh [Smittium culicis]